MLIDHLWIIYFPLLTSEKSRNWTSFIDGNTHSVENKLWSYSICTIPVSELHFLANENAELAGRSHLTAYTYVEHISCIVMEM